MDIHGQYNMADSQTMMNYLAAQGYTIPKPPSSEERFKVQRHELPVGAANFQITYFWDEGAVKTTMQFGGCPVTRKSLEEKLGIEVKNPVSW